MKKLALAFAAMLFASIASAQSFDHSHAAFTTLLKKHVVVVDGGKTSKVKYAELKKEQAQLKAYLNSLSKVTEVEFNAWNKAQQMAFLINAYNGYTLELILQHYPVKSIKDIGGVFDNRWKRKFFKLLGQDSFLDKVEHETLRKPGAYNEPRVHYAVNCASIGCPSLREEAFTPDKLGAQLEEQAVRFLSDRSRNRYAHGKLEVSMIFQLVQGGLGERPHRFRRQDAGDQIARRLLCALCQTVGGRTGGPAENCRRQSAASASGLRLES